jgi:hypothetical protein
MNQAGFSATGAALAGKRSGRLEKRALTRDTIGIGFLSGYALEPIPPTNLNPRNVTDVIFELAAARAFDGARRDLHEEAQAVDRGDDVRINIGQDCQG